MEIGRRILAGGTDLCLKIKEAAERPEMVIDIKGLHELAVLEYVENRLHIGAAVPFTRLIESRFVPEYFPLLRDASATVGSVGVRNRASMGGNLVRPCLHWIAARRSWSMKQSHTSEAAKANAVCRV
jgi:CO/xanthine dehydrogenase FAD-binding subunit